MTIFIKVQISLIRKKSDTFSLKETSWKIWVHNIIWTP